MWQIYSSAPVKREPIGDFSNFSRIPLQTEIVQKMILQFYSMTINGTKCKADKTTIKLMSSWYLKNDLSSKNLIIKLHGSDTESCTMTCFMQILWNEKFYSNEKFFFFMLLITLRWWKILAPNRELFHHVTTWSGRESSLYGNKLKLECVG